MSDEPLPPVEPPAVSPLETTAPGSGLPSPTAAGLASLFSLPGGLVFYYLDRKDPFVRFYAVQAIVLGAIMAIASTTLGLGINIFRPIWLVGWIFVLILNVAWAVFAVTWAAVWIFVTVCAFRGKRWQPSFLASMLKRYTSRLI